MTGCVLFSHKVKVWENFARRTDCSYLIGDLNNKRLHVPEEELFPTLFGMGSYNIIILIIIGTSSRTVILPPHPMLKE
jgi:hypothetical protein